MNQMKVSVKVVSNESSFLLLTADNSFVKIPLLISESRCDLVDPAMFERQ